MEPNEKITLKASTCLFSSEKQRNWLCFSGNEFALVANSCLCLSVSINGALAFIHVNSKFYNGIILARRNTGSANIKHAVSGTWI